MPKPRPTKSSELKAMIGRRMKATVWAVWGKQASAARALGVSPQQLSAACVGRDYPDEALVVLICERSGVPADWIYRGVVAPAPLPSLLSMRIGSQYPDLIPDRIEPASIAVVVPPAAWGAEPEQVSSVRRTVRAARGEKSKARHNQSSS